jgi:glycosyltransferase involved in cell wall biosynthesis
VTPKIVLVANTDWYLYNFRLSLADRLNRDGWEVVMVSPPGPFGERLREAGYRWQPFDLSPGGLEPLQEARAVLRLRKLYRNEQPRLVHHFTIKCVLYGTLASRGLDGVGVVNAVTGLGHVFTDAGVRASLIRKVVSPLYRYCLGRSNVRTVFQNESDLGEFVVRGLLSSDRARVIRGSGVDCERFVPTEATGRGRAPVRVLYASRMLREKGVLELVEAAGLVKGRGVDAEFVFAGSCYPGNPSSLDERAIERWTSEGLIRYLGHVEDMPALLASSDLVVLPSYREGTPRILLEAAAMERPIVATDIPGCRGVAEHEVNGLLVPVRDASALADAIVTLARDKDLRSRFGRAGRRIVLREFDERIVLEKTMAVYRELLADRVTRSEPGGGSRSEMMQ